MKRFIMIIMSVLLVLLTCCAEVPEPEPSETATPTPTPAASPSPTPRPTPSPTPEPTPSPEPVVGNNPLTGLMMDESLEGRRPVAIMFNNLKASMPQCGVSEADIIYEALAEGDVTRMVGVFMDPYKVSTFGSIRSTRAYYLDIAQSHDAVLVHAGGSPEAYNEIPKRGVTTIDGTQAAGVYFYRDPVRKATIGLEHTLFITGAKILEAVEKTVKRPLIKDSYADALRFVVDGTPTDGVPAAKLTLRYSGYKTGIFEYDDATGLYNVSQYNGPYADGNNDVQVAVRNVLVLRMGFTTIAGDEALRRRADIVSTGEGYFLCGGKWVPIQWSRTSHDAPFVYTCEDGTPLELGMGKTYVNLFPKNYAVTLE